MTCREAVNEWLKSIDVPEGSFVLDVGASSNPVSKVIDFSNPHSIFMTWDIDPNANCDYVEDITGEGFIGQYTHLFCISALEHLYKPFKALKNMYNLLEKGGKLYLAVPFIFEEHGDSDYLRYTPKGLYKMVETLSFKNIKSKTVECENGTFILLEAEK